MYISGKKILVGIALTMRDVKLFDCVIMLIILLYCLNYAGCKGGISVRYLTLEPSIALTMRDVKKLSNRNCTGQGLSIALTMRDVKEGGANLIIGSGGYCLNYAGCKVQKT